MDYEKMWNELKDSVKLDADDIGVNATYDTPRYYAESLLEEIEQLEKEFKSKEDFIHTLHNDMFNKQLEKEVEG